MEAKITDLKFETGPDGERLISFRLLGFSHNISAAVAYLLLDHASFRGLPESFVYSPEEWHGIGQGCPVRMRVVGEGSEARLEVMFNGEYAQPRLTEREALLRLPAILKDKGVLADRQDELLRQQIEKGIPST